MHYMGDSNTLITFETYSLVEYEKKFFSHVEFETYSIYTLISFNICLHRYMHVVVDVYI